MIMGKISKKTEVKLNGNYDEFILVLWDILEILDKFPYRENILWDINARIKGGTTTGKIKIRYCLQCKEKVECVALSPFVYTIRRLSKFEYKKKNTPWKTNVSPVRSLARAYMALGATYSDVYTYVFGGLKKGKDDIPPRNLLKNEFNAYPEEYYEWAKKLYKEYVSKFHPDIQPVERKDFYTKLLRQANLAFAFIEKMYKRKV